LRGVHIKGYPTVEEIEEQADLYEIAFKLTISQREEK
jgi:hypothetical protein